MTRRNWLWPWKTLSFVALVIGLLGLTLVGYRVQSARHFGNLPVALVSAARTTAAEAVVLDLQPGSRPEGVPRLVGPIRLDSAAGSEFFSIDDGDGEVVRRHGGRGVVVETYRGGGVPATKSITDIALAPGTLMLVDLLGSSLHTQDIRSGRWSTARTSAEPYRAAHLKDSTFAVMRINTPLLFDVVDVGGAVSRQFGRLLQNQEDVALALDGFMERSSRGFVYAPKYLGVIVGYDADGTIQWLVNTVSPPRAPSVAIEGKSRRVQHSSSLATASLAVAGERVITLAKRAHGLERVAVIDVYGAADGTYERSLRLPLNDEWTSITASETHLLAAHRSGVIAWPRATITGRNDMAGEWIVLVGR